MADYRVYVIGRDGHIVDAIVVSCADDQAAVCAAEGLLRKDTLELWHMDRKVAEFKPPSKWIKWNPFRRRRRVDDAHRRRAVLRFRRARAALPVWNQARGVAGKIVRYARSSARVLMKAAQKAVDSRKKARKG